MEQTIEERLARLERYTHVVCGRCSKTFPFRESQIIYYPGFIDGRILCPDCHSGYEDLIHTKENETRDAVRGYLRELRGIQGG